LHLFTVGKIVLLALSWIGQHFVSLRASNLKRLQKSDFPGKMID